MNIYDVFLFDAYLTYVWADSADEACAKVARKHGWDDADGLELHRWLSARLTLHR
jgi:hypothetical protein